MPLLGLFLCADLIAQTRCSPSSVCYKAATATMTGCCISRSFLRSSPFAHALRTDSCLAAACAYLWAFDCNCLAPASCRQLLLFSNRGFSRRHQARSCLRNGLVAAGWTLSGHCCLILLAHRVYSMKICVSCGRSLPFPARSWG